MSKAIKHDLSCIKSDLHLCLIVLYARQSSYLPYLFMSKPSVREYMLPVPPCLSLLVSVC